jgi:hypothetical protein
MSDRTKKLLLVSFLTLLIWVWAYFAQEKSITKTATLNIFEGTNTTQVSDILVTFDVPSPLEFELNMKGPASKVQELNKKLLDGEEDFIFIFNAELEEKIMPGTYTINLPQFLQSNPKTKALGLTVESCSIETVDVIVEQLVKKQARLEVVDENGTILEYEEASPARINGFFRQETLAKSLKATVKLTSAQVNKARQNFVSAMAYIEVKPGLLRPAATVGVKLPSVEETLKDCVIQPGRIGYIISPNIIGKYNIELLNKTELTSKILYKATDGAKDAYEKSQYYILINIDEEAGEKNLTTGQINGESKVIYNFPVEYVELGEIKLSKPQPDRNAKYKLTPIKVNVVD